MSPPKKSVFEGCDPTQVAMLERSYLAAWGIVRTKRLRPGQRKKPNYGPNLLAAFRSSPLGALPTATN